MQVIEKYVSQGGVVLALDRVPGFSTGFEDYRRNDQQVRKIVEAMFTEPFGRDAVGTEEYGQGRTHYLKHVIDRQIWWDQRSSMLDPFLKTIQMYVLLQGCIYLSGIDTDTDGCTAATASLLYCG